MTHYQLTLTSKDKDSLTDFLVVFYNITKQFNFIKKHFNKKAKKKIITILKSPHVNKTAQEQFEFRTFSKHLNIYSPLNFKTLILLKYIQTNLFPNVKITIKFNVNKKISKNYNTNILNPNNYKIDLFNNSKIFNFCNYFKNTKHLKNYLKKNCLENTKTLTAIFDNYGKLVNDNKSLDSSVGRAKD